MKKIKTTKVDGVNVVYIEDENGHCLETCDTHSQFSVAAAKRYLREKYYK